MIFADKLILLRKKAGWSQEELADQMNVTRQSVSKWEGAQSVPDLEKMIRLSKLFGVSTDYLLKDEIEEAEHISLSDDAPTLRRVSMDEANTFLSVFLPSVGLWRISSSFSAFSLASFRRETSWGYCEPIISDLYFRTTL